MGNNYAGFTQYIAQDTLDTVNAALVILGVETTLTGAYVTIYSPGGAELVSRTAATTSGNLASYSHSPSWQSGSFSRDYGYKAQFELEHAGGTKIINVFFEVVRQRFESMVGSSDLRKLEPRLVNPSGQSDLSQFINEAWEQITQQASAKIGMYAGNIFDPERFRKAHQYLSLAQYFRASQFGSAGTADADKARYYTTEATKALKVALSSVDVDLNDDGKLGQTERNKAFNSIPAYR